MDRMTTSGELKFYKDLSAKVRGDGKYHPIRALVQPDDPDVKNIARVLIQTNDFIEASHEFVNKFTTYRREVGEYWALPSEMLSVRSGDCDDSGILLCSILRNYIPPEKVYVAIGVWSVNGKPDGHAWVVAQEADGEDMVLESTAAPSKPIQGKYLLSAMFNDQYCYATDVGIRDFELKVVEREAEVVAGI